jgi:hypothetical protein
MTVDYNQQLNVLLEREREIMKKMNLAIRAGANTQILGHFDFLLEECKIQQQELRLLQKNQDKDHKDFDDFLSIG